MDRPVYEPLQAFGDFPPVLFRVFDEERWARAFIEEGRMRFRLVDYYAQLEDKVRADRSEGVSRLLVPGDVHHVLLNPEGKVVGIRTEKGRVEYTGEFINPIYIYCFSYLPGGDPSKLPGKFGKYIVRVDDPQRLAQEVTDWLTAEGKLRGTPVVECRAVLYNKGEESEDIADHGARTRLAYTQKPPSFADECEYRFAVKATPPPGDVELGTDHDVVLGKRLDYASLFVL